MLTLRLALPRPPGLARARSTFVRPSGTLARATGSLVLVAALSAAGAVAQDAVGLSVLDRARVERLLENRYACRGCHTIGGRGGLIGPVLDGVGARATPEYVLSVIRDPAATIPGTIMPRQPVPEADADRLARYLASLPVPEAPPEGVVPQPPAPIAPGSENDGAALYARHCAACHGSEGRGDGWNAVRLPVAPTAHADAALMAERPDDTLYDGIAVGGWVLDKSPTMPSFAALLAPAQIRALVAHIRELCACEQPAWARGGD